MCEVHQEVLQYFADHRDDKIILNKNEINRSQTKQLFNSLNNEGKIHQWE